MATSHHVLTATSPNIRSSDSSPLIMLLSAVPDGLQRLADLGKHPAPRLHFSVEGID
jgi:hypothetical protein